MIDKNLLEKLSNFTLLYIESDDTIREKNISIFKSIFKDVFQEKNGEDAYSVFVEKKPDLLITEINISKLNGFDLVKKIHKINSKTRVIILSSQTSLQDLLKACELHLVKYIVKPLCEENLTSALQAFIDSFEKSRLYILASRWLFDEGKSTISGPEKKFILTRKESSFLKLLLTKHRLISYEEIENHIWGDEHFMTQNALRLFVKNFRKKLPPNIIKNVQGLGYQLIEPSF